MEVEILEILETAAITVSGFLIKRQGIYSDILNDRYLSDMVVAAPLHDIGKIHIPDAVLNKPGKLTEEEFEIMKTHTTAGEALLAYAKAELGESGYLKQRRRWRHTIMSGGTVQAIPMASEERKYHFVQELWQWQTFSTH